MPIRLFAISLSVKDTYIVKQWQGWIKWIWVERNDGLWNDLTGIKLNEARKIRQSNRRTLRIHIPPQTQYAMTLVITTGPASRGYIRSGISISART
uniref:Uncharacterized protein n=1 Tax=Salmonella sp. TaxID=599 RepID=A0A482EUK0_SALSP|nr:hypothetical protein NNIBIDOC_00185 [Salmonella sp.]